MRRPGVLLLALSLAGCATLPGRSGSPATPRSATPDAADQVTEAQINQLQRQAAMADAEIRLLRRQLAALGIELERLASASLVAPTAAPMNRPTPPAMPRLDEIESSDLEPVRIEPVRMDQAAAEPPVMEPQRIEPQVTGPVAAPIQVPASPAPTTAVPAAGQAIYDSGYTLYHQGRFVDAETSFQRFLQAHGNTELADNAQFWIGESRFARGDNMGALLAFQEVLDLYPSGNKVADSMLKAGDCLMRLDNREAGIQRYQEVLRRFPGSAAAVMAEERLSLSGD